MLKGTRAERIQCLIDGRLIAIVMLSMLARPAAWYARVQYQRELSGHKFINWVKRKARLSQVIAQGGLTTLFDLLAQGLLRLCKQRRKRPTTKQLIDHKINYMDSFIDTDAVTQEA